MWKWAVWGKSINLFLLEVVFRCEAYCCDILQGKSMSGVRHGTMVSQLSIQGIVSREKFCIPEGATWQNMHGTLMARKGNRNITNNISGMMGTKHRWVKWEEMFSARQVESSYLIICVSCHLEKLKHIPSLLSEYFVFMYEPLHTFRFGIQKLLKNVLWAILGLQRYKIKRVDC